MQNMPSKTSERKQGQTKTQTRSVFGTKQFGEEGNFIPALRKNTIMFCFEQN